MGHFLQLLPHPQSLQIQECPYLSLHLFRFVYLHDGVHMLISEEYAIIGVDAAVGRDRLIREQEELFDDLEAITFSSDLQFSKHFQHGFLSEMLVLVPEDLVNFR